MFFVTFRLMKRYHIMDLERGVIIDKTSLLVQCGFNPYAVQRHTSNFYTVHIISSHYSMVLCYFVLPYCLLFCVHLYNVRFAFCRSSIKVLLID